MTSAKSSSINTFSGMQKLLFKRSFWLAALNVLYLLLYYPAGTILQLVRIDMINEGQPLSMQLQSRLSEVSTWLGIRTAWLFPVVLLGIITGLQAFGYLFSMVKMDFYQSQPVSGRKVFFGKFVHGILLFELPLFVIGGLTIPVLYFMHSLNGAGTLEILLQMARMSVYFISGYCVTIFAAMVTGNLPVAAGVSVFLNSLDFIFLKILLSYEQQFFKTFVGIYDLPKRYYGIFPLGNAFFGSELVSGGQFMSDSYSPMRLQLLGTLYGRIFPADIAVLLTGLVCFIAGYRLFKKRKAESAGKSVVFAPVRVCIKFIAGTAAGLGIGTLIFDIFNVSSDAGKNGNSTMLIAAGGILCGAFLVSSLIECIYEQSIRGFFKSLWQTTVICAAAVLIMLTFRHDVFGYDRFVPDASKVAYAQLTHYPALDSSYSPAGTQDLKGSFNSLMDFQRQNMKLTNIPAVIDIAKEGQAALVRATDDESGFSAQVTYYMKNGRVISRNLLIPYSIQAKKLDAVWKSEEFKEGFFPVYHDAERAQQLESWDVQYLNGVTRKKGPQGLYRKIAQAYREDLSQYNAATAMSLPIGVIRFDASWPMSKNVSGEIVLPVYTGFNNTVAVLKKADLWLDPAADCVDLIGKVTVSYYGDDGQNASRTYTDSGKIEEIIKHMKPDDLDGDLIMTDDIRWDVAIDIFPKDESGSYTGNFKKDDIPSFIVNDLQLPEE